MCAQKLLQERRLSDGWKNYTLRNVGVELSFPHFRFVSGKLAKLTEETQGGFFWVYP